MTDIDELAAVVRAAVADHPDRRNPADPHCLYTDQNDPDWHCIVGEVAARLGWRVPGPDYVGGADFAADRYDWPVTRDQARWLASIQGAFDTGATWQAALTACQDDGLIVTDP